jgi:hypothetical protein
VDSGHPGRKRRGRTQQGTAERRYRGWQGTPAAAATLAWLAFPLTTLIVG